MLYYVIQSKIKWFIWIRTYYNLIKHKFNSYRNSRNSKLKYWMVLIFLSLFYLLLSCNYYLHYLVIKIYQHIKLDIKQFYILSFYLKRFNNPIYISYLQIVLNIIINFFNVSFYMINFIF